MNFYKDPPTSERPSPPKGIDGKITISLTRAEAEELLDELQSLHGYHWNDDHIHARDCGSKILSTIEEQIRFHDLKNSASK